MSGTAQFVCSGRRFYSGRSLALFGHSAWLALSPLPTIPRFILFVPWKQSVWIEKPIPILFCKTKVVGTRRRKKKKKKKTFQIFGMATPVPNISNRTFCFGEKNHFAARTVLIDDTLVRRENVILDENKCNAT